MAIIKRNGTPTRQTVGSIGDIYVDLLSGKQYKCTFAYKNSNQQGDYVWKLIPEEAMVPVKPEVKKEVAKEVKKETKVKTEKPVEIVEEKVEEVKPETEVKPESTKPPRTNYTQYSKKSK